MIATDQIVRWIQLSAQALAANKTNLTELDSAIGDADHGINMDRGFKNAAAKLPAVENADLGTVLKTVGMALIGSVGGASGPLYGTFFLEAAKVANGKRDLSGADLVLLFDAGIKGIVRLGKANPGDKTMLDALLPGLAALKERVAAGDTEAGALQAMCVAARAGMEATIPLVARKGRASYLGERSAGHQDPGATSAVLIVEALHTAVLA